jgi:hypothetical protein
MATKYRREEIAVYRREAIRVLLEQPECWKDCQIAAMLAVDKTTVSKAREAMGVPGQWARVKRLKAQQARAAAAAARKSKRGGK